MQIYVTDICHMYLVVLNQSGLSLDSQCILEQFKRCDVVTQPQVTDCQFAPYNR